MKTRGMPTRPRFWTLATCGFVGNNRGVLGGFRFFPALPKYAVKTHCPEAKTRQHPVVAETSKGRCRKTEQRPFFVIASRRVRDDCITGYILPKRRVILERTGEIAKKEGRRINPLQVSPEGFRGRQPTRGHIALDNDINYLLKFAPQEAYIDGLMDVRLYMNAVKFPTKPTLPITRLGQQNKPLSGIIERSHSVISVFILTNAPNKR